MAYRERGEVGKVAFSLSIDATKILARKEISIEAKGFLIWFLLVEFIPTMCIVSNRKRKFNRNSMILPF